MPPADRSGGVTRPSLPPLAWFAASMWSGIAFGESLIWNAWPVVWVACAVEIALVTAGWLLWRARRCPGVLPVLLGLGVGILVGCAFWAHVGVQAARLSSAGTGPFVCEVVADPVKGDFGYSLVGRVRGGVARGALVKVMTSGDAEPPGCGRLVEIRGRSGRDRERDEWARRAHRQGSAGRLTAWSISPRGTAPSLRGLIAPGRTSLLAAVGRIPGAGAALLQGVLLGERSGVRGTALEEEFRTAGLSHLLAVSGTHISIVSALAGVLLVRLHVPLRWRLAFVLVVAGSYVLLTGAPVSSLRAFVMAVAAGLSTSGGRRADSLGGLSAAVVGLLACSPANAFDLGFALSVCAVGGLVLFAPLAEEWACAASTRRFRSVAAALSLPVVAQCATMPVAVPAFHMVSVIGPVANALVLPVASAGLGLGVAGCVLYALAPPLGRLALGVSAGVFGAVVWVVARLASLPRAAIAVGGSAGLWGIVCLAVGAWAWIAWPRPPTRRTARAVIGLVSVAVALFVIGFQGAGGARLVVLDVGQGDAILVADGSAAVLVDTGPDAGAMREAVARTGVRELDAVLLTHPHADHDGGLEGLTGVVDVGEVLVPAATLGDFRDVSGRSLALTGREPGVLTQGDRIEVGGWVLDVLWPPGDVEGFDTNNTSLIVEATHGDFRAILTGDAESVPQERLLDAGMLRRCDVLKVPHHGSDEGILPGSLEVWSPGLALVSVGEGNDHGHPAASTMALLALHGIQARRTDHSGDLTIRVSRDSYCLSTGRPARVRQ